MHAGHSPHDELRDMQPGDHLCCLYDTEKERRQLVHAFLEQGLRKNHKVLCIVDDGGRDESLQHLRDSAFHFESFLNRGQLEFLTAGEAYLQKGTFDVETMMELLHRETDRAVEGEYEALRVAGKMNWALEKAESPRRLVEYEAELRSFFSSNPVLALCQYDRSKFSAELLLEILQTHPKVAIGKTIYDNFFWVSPRQRQEYPASAQLEHWLTSLQEHREQERALEISARQLRESEQRYRNFFKTSKDAVFITTPDGEWLDMNQALVDLFGYKSRQEMEQVPVKEVYANPEQRREHIRLIEQEGFLKDHPVTLRRKNGQIIEARITSVPIFNTDGELVGFQGTIRDVTDRQEFVRRVQRLKDLLYAIRNVNQIIVQEADLRQMAEKACRALVEARSYQGCTIAFLQDAGGRIEPVAHAGEPVFPQDWSISPAGDGEAPTCVRHAVTKQSMCIRDTANECSECAYRSQDTKHHSATVPMKQDGQVVGLLHAHLEQRKAVDDQERSLLDEMAQDLGFAWQKVLSEKALRESQRRMSTLIENLPGMAYRCLNERPWPMEFCSEGTLDLTGYEPDDILSNDVFYGDLIHPDDRESVWNEIQKAVRADLSFEVEYRIRTRQGDEKWVEERGQAVTDGDSEQKVLEGIVTDITERRKAERALQKTNERLEKTLQQLRETQEQVIDQERQRALSTMASGIAHDFNNALSTIRGFSDLLLRMPAKRRDEETLEQYLRHIRKATSNAAETVRRMRKFYRPQEESPLEPVDLNGIINEAFSMARPRWREEARAQGAEIEVKKDLGGLPPVEGNEAELHEMLTNLIFNAVDAMPNGGTLSVRTRREDKKTVWMAISDTGIGMSEEVRRHCLDPFYSTKEEAGSGLGLSTVQGIVQRHEGELSVQSRKGEGSTFCIRLPVAQSEVPDTGEELPPGPRIKGLRILVIEDERHQRELLEEYLNLDDHQVELASDGKQGFERFQDSTYDLVITDRAMPEMSGDEVAHRIRNNAPGVPVIMLTGFGDMMAATSENVAGVDTILPKPVNLRELREAIAELSGAD